MFPVARASDAPRSFRGYYAIFDYRSLGIRFTVLILPKQSCPRTRSVRKAIGDDCRMISG